MRTKTYFLVLMSMLALFCEAAFAIPSQEDFYHKVYKIEWKGSNGKVLTRYPQSPQAVELPNGMTGLVNPSFGEHVSLYFVYTGSARQQWIIAPISPNSSEFYIINKETGYPLMIDGTNIRINTSGITDDRQRFKFKNINGDYFQIESASTPGYFYKMDNPVTMIPFGGVIGYYNSLSYVNTTSSINDDYSYFKLTEVGDITGSGNVSAANLVSQPNLLFNIGEPPQITSYTQSAPLYSNETVIGESWVPFTLINDDSYSLTGQFTQTPFYKLVRKQAWKKIKDYSYEPGAQYTIAYKHYKGITSAEKQTTQATLEHSWSLNGSAEFTLLGVKVSLGSSYSEKLSTSVTQVNEYSVNTWEEITETLVFNTQASVRFIVYELVDRYYIQRMDGSDVVSPLEILYDEYYKFRTWSSQPITVTNNASTHTTTITPNYTPQNLTVGASYNHPYIQWNASAFPNLAYYEIWKKKNGTWSLNTTTTTTNYTDASELIVAPSVVVNYKVCAVNNTGQKTGFSNEVGISVMGSMAKGNPDGADSMKTCDIPAVLQMQNYPNPFNPSTIISYDIPEAARVTLKVYDLLGREVADLVNEYKEAGRYNVTFDASHLSTGIYIYQLRANDYVSVKKMSFIK